MSSDNQVVPAEEEGQCGRCQHKVEVRGVDQVVCLAYLAVRHPMKDGICCEFERKRTKAGTAATE